MHHGIKGQKWGIRRTPEQLGHYIERKEKKISFYQKKANEARAKGDSKLYYKYLEKQKKASKLIEKARSKMPKAQEREEKYQLKQEKKEARHQAKLEKQAAKKAEEKENFLRTASAEELMERRGEFSDDEIARAIRRLQTAKQIEDLNRQINLSRIQEQQRQKQEKFDSAMGFANKLITGFNKYEDVARVVNKITGEETLTVFSDKGKKEYDALFKEVNNSLDYSKIMANRDKLKPEDFNIVLDTYHKAKGVNRTNVMKALGEEITQATDTIKDYDNRIATGRTEKHTAQTNKTTAESDYTAAQTAVHSAESALRTAQYNERTKKEEMKNAKQEWKDAVKRADRMAASGNTSAAATLRVTAAGKASVYYTKESEYNTARANVAAAQSHIDSAKQAVNSAKEALDRRTEELNQVNERLNSIIGERDQVTNFIRDRRKEVWLVNSD